MNRRLGAARMLPLLGLLFMEPVRGQEQAAEESSLEAITVTAPRATERVTSPVLRLEENALRDRQPELAPEAFRGLPGTSIRPNSRGESVVRIRGSEERQSVVFLDGAPLAVPWDGRVDLGVLPAGLIKSVGVSKGAVPMEYGANTVAGAVDLETSGSDEDLDAHVGAGTGNLRALSAAGQWQSNDATGETWRTTAAAALFTRDFVSVAEVQALPFSQPDETARTNSDLSVRSVFGALGRQQESGAWRVSMLHANVARGIAPEGHLDPTDSAPRYWRYPDWTLTQLNMVGETVLAEGLTVRGVLWRQWFSQTIDAYQSESYDSLRARQRDRDDTLGARVTISHEAGPLHVRWSASAQDSTHAQHDEDSANALPSEFRRYRQELRSAGVEADWRLVPKLRLSLGVGRDAAATPFAGDKAPQGGRARSTYTAALGWDVTHDLTVTVSGGRRARFATARELYGEALGRFLANPALLPETADMLDLDVAWHTDDARGSLNPFYQRNTDTLSQRIVTDAGRALRQRFNLPGSESYGVDLYGAFALTNRLALELGGTWLRTRVSASPDFIFRKLPQRPTHDVFLALDWRSTSGLDLRGEVRRVGRAFDIAENGAAVELGSSTDVNLRATIPLLRLGERAPLQLVLAIDNATDEVMQPQLGLPLPGRTYRMGLRL